MRKRRQNRKWRYPRNDWKEKRQEMRKRQWQASYSAYRPVLVSYIRMHTYMQNIKYMVILVFASSSRFIIIFFFFCILFWEVGAVLVSTCIITYFIATIPHFPSNNHVSNLFLTPFFFHFNYHKPRSFFFFFLLVLFILLDNVKNF